MSMTPAPVIPTSSAATLQSRAGDRASSVLASRAVKIRLSRSPDTQLSPIGIGEAACSLGA